jgi:hypothetical protein
MRSYSLPHLRHLVARRLQGAAGLKSIASEHIVVCGEEREQVPPAIFLPNQVENIRSLHPEAIKEQEDFRLYGGEAVHAATEAFRIDNVRLKDDGLYRKNWSYYFPKITPARIDPPIRGGVRSLASSNVGVQYWGHWIHDDVPRYELAETFAPPVATPTPSWPHKQLYAELLEQSWTSVADGEFDSLYVLSDYGQNTHRVERYRKLRARLRKNRKPVRQGQRVYLRRGSTGAVQRLLSNEDEVITALEKEGFLIVDITKDDFDTIFDAMYEARLLISIEGSHAAPAIFTLGERAGFLTIVSPTMFTNLMKDWSIHLGMTYGFVVGEHEGESFRVNIPDLLKTADLIERQLSE